MMLRDSAIENHDGISAPNPWSSSSTFINVGSLHKVISLAERTGHVNRDSDEKDEIKKYAFETSPSMYMIRILREITQLGQALDKVNLELQNLVRDAETVDVTHVDTLGRRTHQLTQLSTHLSTIIVKKDELISRLQQPFISDYLVMDCAYHYDTSASLPKIASCLAGLPKHLENISWSNALNLSDGRLEGVLSSIESSFAELQSHFRAADKARKAMEQLQQITRISH